MHLLQEQRIGRELERFDSLGLQSERAPDAMYGRRRVAISFALPQGPMRCAFRPRFQRLADRSCDLIIVNLSRFLGSSAEPSQLFLLSSKIHRVRIA
jgi:hypothetical protein